MGFYLDEKELLSCSGSRRFARKMAAAAPFTDYQHAAAAAKEIWFNKVDVSGWMESFAAHPEIGVTKQISQQCKDEQSTALATATDSVLQDMLEWNARYKKKFGFVFLICASGKGMPEIQEELKKRYPNRPIVELEIAAGEEMKIIKLRLAKLFEKKASKSPLVLAHHLEIPTDKPRDRIGILGAHLTAVPMASGDQTFTVSGSSKRTRPPITTHILDVSRGSAASGVEVILEMWKSSCSKAPSFGNGDPSYWVHQGSSTTDNDGRSGPLMKIVDYITPGYYRISFNTGKYVPSGFFPYVSIVFEVRETQKSEHFHIPLLLSPFSFTTYRGS